MTRLLSWGARPLLLVLLAAFALLGGARTASADQGDDWRITRYDVTAETASDGTTRVTTDIDFDFGDDPGHGPYFTQSLRSAVPDDPDRWRSTPIDDVSVSSSTGAPTDVSSEEDGGVLVLRIGDEDVEVSGVQSYRVSWLQRGLVTPEAVRSGLDELAWDVIAPAWEVPLENITVTVTGPVPAERYECRAGEEKSTTPCTTATPDGDRTTFTLDRADPGEGLTVVTGWPAGTVTAAPIYTKRFWIGNLFPPTPLTVGGGGLLGLALAGGAAWLVRRNRDEHYVGLTPGLSPAAGSTASTARGRARTPVAVRFTPPDDAGPAQVGTVLDEVAHSHDVTAALVDLAVRGHLRIEAVQAAGADRSDEDGDEGWRLVRLPPPGDDLRTHERTLLDGLFGDADVVELEDVEFLTVLGATQQDLYREVTEHGWFRTDPASARRRWFAAGMGLLVLGIGLTLLLAFSLGAGLVGVGVVLGAVVVLSLSGRAAARTAAGSALLDQALGFKLYLATAEADQIRVEEAEQVFSRYLPYAIAFGEAEHWAGVFAELARRGHDLDTTAWWVGTSPVWTSSSGFGAQLDSFTSSVSSSMTASSSSSGGGSGFGGGVGGGVGGGGGGGW